MARLLLTSSLDRYAKRHDWLRKLLFLMEAAIAHAAFWICRLLGPDRACRVGRRLIGRIGPRTPKHHILTRNLALAFPERDAGAIEVLARATWGNIGAVVGEYPHLARIALEHGRLELVDQCGLDAYKPRVWRGGQGGGRSAVFVGAHLSNWEVMALVAASEGIPLTALYAPFTNIYLAKVADRARRQLGCTLLSREASLRPMLTELKSGRSLGILADVRVAGGLCVPFFHHDMETSPTPARLAVRYGADIIPVRAERLGDARFRVTVLPPLEPSPAGLPQDRAVFDLTRRINSCFEGWIREQPDEWVATNRRWDKSFYKRE